MRQITKFLITLACTLFWVSLAQAAFFSLPRQLNLQLSKVGFAAPVLPPIGHSGFCHKYPEDCAVQGIDFRHRKIALTAQRWNELNSVNRDVNGEIVPEITPGDAVTKEWVIAPAAGDCKDYAITKRHKLLARGWPSRALLLAEVVVPSGEHHLILVVRLAETDLVLDNLSPNIRTVAMTYDRYQWVRMETSQNPRFWARVETTTRSQTATLGD
jgi:predicted transglutaminase-like cysteine proteinase